MQQATVASVIKATSFSRPPQSRQARTSTAKTSGASRINSATIGRIRPLQEIGPGDAACPDGFDVRIVVSPGGPGRSTRRPSALGERRNIDYRGVTFAASKVETVEVGLAGSSRNFMTVVMEPSACTVTTA